MSLAQDLQIYKAASDLLTLALQVQAQVPRAYRVAVGQRISNECADIVLTVARANVARGDSREREIGKLLEHLEATTLLLRISHNLRLISSRVWAQSVELTDSVGKQAHGWLKATARQPTAFAPHHAFGYTSPVSKEIRAWSPGSQGAASRTPFGDCGFSFAPDAARGMAPFLAGRAGLPKGGAGSLTRSTNPHGLPPSLGREGGRFKNRRQGAAMAYPRTQPELGLHIRINPETCHARWVGTRADLEAEGFLPSDLSWPACGSDSARFNAPGCWFSLRLVAGQDRAPESQRLYRLEHYPDSGLIDRTQRLLTLKIREAQEIAAVGSPQWCAAWDRQNTARLDQPFQSFKRALLGQKKRGRKPATESQAQSINGAGA